MPISVACSTCGSKIKAPDSAAGKKAKCPKCGASLVVPLTDTSTAASEHVAAPLTNVAPPPPAVVQSRPPVAAIQEVLPSRQAVDYKDCPFCGEEVLTTALKCKHCGETLDPALRTAEEPRSRRRPSAAAAVSNTIIVQQPSRAAHSLGIAALVIGVLSFFVCWIPFLGIAVSGLGLLLGLGGLVLAVVRRGSGVGFSIAGSGLSALSLVSCLVWTFALSSAFKAVDNAVDKQNRTNQVAVPDSKPDKPPAPPAKSEPEWADASKGAVRQGDLQVQITQVTIGQVPLKTITGNSKSKDNLLMVKLKLLNMNPTKKVEYHSWSGKDISFDRDFATLEDNFGNSYKRISFGLGSYPVGAVERSASIYPNKSVTDVLVFEVPLNTIEYLRLELPAKNFGGTGMLRLQIPKAMIQR